MLQWLHSILWTSKEADIPEACVPPVDTPHLQPDQLRVNTVLQTAKTGPIEDEPQAQAQLGQMDYDDGYDWTNHALENIKIDNNNSNTNSNSNINTNKHGNSLHDHDYKLTRGGATGASKRLIWIDTGSSSYRVFCASSHGIEVSKGLQQIHELPSNEITQMTASAFQRSCHFDSTNNNNNNSIDSSAFVLHQEDRQLIMLPRSRVVDNAETTQTTTVVKLWDIETGQMTPLKVHRDVTLHDIHPIHKYAASTLSDMMLAISENQIHLLDTRVSQLLVHSSSKVVSEWSKDTIRFNTLTTCANGSVAVGSHSGEVVLFEADLQDPWAIYNGVGSSVQGIDITSSGDCVLASSDEHLFRINVSDGGDDKNFTPVKLFSLQPGDKLRHPLFNRDDFSVTSSAMSGSTNHISSCSSTNHISSKDVNAIVLSDNQILSIDSVANNNATSCLPLPLPFTFHDRVNQVCFAPHDFTRLVVSTPDSIYIVPCTL